MKKLALGSVALLACALTAACASSDPQAPAPQPSDSTPGAAAQTAAPGRLGARYRGTFGAGKGLAFERLPMPGAAGAGEQAFKLDTGSKFTFATLSSTGGFYCSGANNCADCTSGTCGALGTPHPLFSDCGAGGVQTCGQVNVDPGAASFDDVWVVISNVTTTNGTVTFSGTDTPPSTYNPPLSGAVYYKYGTLEGASANKRMNINYSGGFDPTVDSVNFTVEVYSSGRYTGYTVSGPAVATPPDACAGGTVLLDDGGGESVTSLFSLPFPFTIYQLNPSHATPAAYVDKGWVSDNGVFGIGATGASDNSNNVPSSQFGFGSAVGMVFWADLNLAYAGDSKVCMKTLGTAPNRQLVLRWHDVDINLSGTTKVSMTAIVYEGTDVLEYYYEEPTAGGITSDTRGIDAVVGVQGTNPLGVTRVGQAAVTPNTVFLPATGGAANYPVRYTLTPN
ncbi:MAG: hypothetical protein IT374_02370 [Polyangiaceae bacterium]|nr:hypothetical protein [Polyangiaceae bacterium]